jgi:hypothetical protein
MKIRARIPIRAAVLAAVAVNASLLGLAVLCAATSAHAFPSTGPQDILVVPIEHHCIDGSYSCLPAPQRALISSPRHSPAEWETMLNGQVNTFYTDSTWGQTSWRFRVVADPESADGWWPSAHPIEAWAAAIAAAPDGRVSLWHGPVAIAQDAAENFINQAIRRGVLAASDLGRYHRLLIIDNWHRRGGQTNSVGSPEAYTVPLSVLPEHAWYTTASVVAEDTSDNAALTVIDHELGHQLGLYDLYGNCLGFRTVPLRRGTDPECVGPWDHMAYDSFGTQFGGFSKLLVGWLPHGFVRHLRASSLITTDVTLSPLERVPVRGVPSLLRISVLNVPVSDEHRFTGYQVECRRAINEDARLPSTGVLVTYVNTSAARQTWVLRPPGAAGNVASAALAPGQVLRLPGSITVTATGSDNDGNCLLTVGGPSTFHPQVATIHPNPFTVIAGGRRGHLFESPDIAVRARGSLLTGDLTVRVRNEGVSATNRIPLVVRVASPYAVTLGCGKALTTTRGAVFKRLVKPLPPGATTLVRFNFKRSRSVSVNASLPKETGPLGETIAPVTSGVALLRVKPGRASTWTFFATADASCKKPIVARLAAVNVPEGWTVRVATGERIVKPGSSTKFAVQVVAPARLAHNTVVPIEILRSDARSLITKPFFYYSGRDDEPVAGVDLIAHSR